MKGKPGEGNCALFGGLPFGTGEWGRGKRKIARAASVRGRILIDEKPQRAFNSEEGEEMRRMASGKKKQET